MADKLTSIKIKQKNGSYTSQIPIGVTAQNVQWDGTHSLLDILGSVDINTGGKGNVQHQFDDIYQNINNFTDNINLSVDEIENSFDTFKNDVDKDISDFTSDINSSVSQYTTNLNNSFSDFQNGINQHLSDVLGNIDTSETGKGSVQHQMDQLYNDVTNFHNQMTEQIGTNVVNWLDNNVTPVGSAVTIDKTLNISNNAADSKVVGDTINALNTIYTTLATSKRTVIPDNTDIDTLAVGNYKITTSTKAKTMINLPTTQACIIFVLSLADANSIGQFCLSVSATKPNIFYREKVASGTFTQWIKIYDVDRDETIDATIASHSEHLTNVDEQIASFDTAYLTMGTSRRVVIPDNTDIDTLTVGNYKIGTVAKAVTMINLPTSRPCIIFVLSMGAASALCQFCLSSSPDKPNIFYRQRNSVNDGYTNWVKLFDIERDEEIENKIEDTKNFDCGYPLSVTQIPVYRVIKTLVPVSEWIDNVDYDSHTYNQTQGICSDGKRYLYYPLRTGTVAYGDSNIMLIRKWDTYYNKPAGLHISTIPYGHGEDIEYIPAWAKGFDNGNVNRLYIIDMERYATGLTIHVVNADTLEYITSFQTAELPPYGLTEYWRGANHVMFNAQRGEIVLNSIHTDDNNVHRCILAIYDKDGNYERGVIFIRTTGTQLGCACDENYIYLTRYASNGDVLNHYIYMLDWNLNPIGKAEIERTYWEWEGICSIGQDVYTSWIMDGTSKGVAIIKNNVIIKDYPYSTPLPFETWSTTDGFKLNTFEPIPTTTENT